MDDVAMLFILVGGIILVLLLVTKESGSGRLRVGGAELLIDFGRPGWRHPRRRAAAGPGRGPIRGPYLAVQRTRWRYPLDAEPVIIGRDADCHVVLLDPTAAPRQAVIYWQDGRYKINNLATNPYTLVDGRSIGSQNLGNGNKIRLGRTELIFRGRARQEK